MVLTILKGVVLLKLINKCIVSEKCRSVGNHDLPVVGSVDGVIGVGQLKEDYNTV